jgi:hypothetical protein
MHWTRWVTRQPEQLLDKSVLDSVKARFTASLLVDDPVAYSQQRLKVWLWSKQREIALALETYNRVAVRSCHDSGKSFIAAVLAARWLDSHPVGQARVITTAPTGMQVKGILWVEINQLHEKAGLPGRVNQTEWWIGSYMAGVGRKPADYRPEAFSGLHARWPLIIIDEAGGVSASLIDAAETLATNVNAKMLLIGNPDDPQSMFADIHADPDKFGYHTIRISAWDTPNFTDEAQELLSNPDPAAQVLPEVLLSPAWVEGRRKAWGEDHPFWASKIEAEFPSQDTTAIVRMTDIVQARVPFEERGDASAHDGWEVADGGPPSLAASHPNLPQTPAVASLATANAHDLLRFKHWPTTLGVDVAGSETGDETVVRLVSGPPANAVGIPQVVSSAATALAAGNPNSQARFAQPGLRVTTEWRVRSGDASIVADKVIEAVIQTDAKQINIDSIGVGFGIIGLVRERLVALGLSKRTRVTGINNAAKASDPVTFGNLRAELWWTMGRYLFARGLIDTSRADSREELEAQLLMPRYKIGKGKIYVEAKDEIKARLGRSPDNADALVYALGSNKKGAGVAVVSRPPQVSIDPRTMGGRTMTSTGSHRLINQTHDRFGISIGARQ